MFSDFSIQVDGFKSFSNGLNMENISPINIIIGKNNSGKSNVIEIVNHAFKEILVPERSGSIFPSIKISFTNTFDELKEKHDLGHYRDYSFDLQEYNKYSVKCLVLLDDDKSGQMIWRRQPIQVGDRMRNYLETEATDEKIRTLSSCSCLYVQAERTMVPEERLQLQPGSKYLHSIHPNGSGLTNLLRHILNSKSDAIVIKNLLINKMNEILAPEIVIEDVSILSVKDDDSFEIYVKESGKPPYPLSGLGSGIKTTMQLILNTEVIPDLTSKDRQHLVFTLEELENNMHPSAQRRLYRYIQNYAKNHGSIFFISTHSNIPLNYFFGKTGTSTYHVIQNNGVSEIVLISGQQKSREILDDLGANPSDLLQSNGIVWVEGPSDRIYIKKWLELAGFGDCIEGYHYQFMYYGGRLLNHYSTEDTEQMINMLRTNRHSALVMDSDKKGRNSPINKTKKRVQDEFRENGLFTWCTKGKEIENYLLSCDIKKAYPKQNDFKIEQYQPFSDFPMKKHNKIVFAKDVTACMSIDSLSAFDLKEQINKLGKEIRKWNDETV